MPREQLALLWDRLRTDVVFRASALYAAASWFLIEAADTFGVGPRPLRLLALGLGIGFVLVVVAALLFRWLSHRRTGGVPAPSQARSHPRAYAVLGTVAVFCILALGMWVLRAQAARAAVPEAAQQMAILPFHATGSDEVRELGVGMVDLLSAALNDVGGIRTIATRTVLAQVGEGEAASTGAAALETGRRLEAGAVLTGSITAFGDRARLVAEIRDVDDGDVIATAQVEGALVNVLTLTDELAVALLRELWRSRAPMPTVNVAGLTTGSPAALRAYLRGEEHLRGMSFDSAEAHFRDAVDADSTFALAWMRLGEVAGWIHDNAAAKGHIERAAAFIDRLPEREQTRLRGQLLAVKGDFAAFDTMQAFVNRYPDDPMGWYELGDLRFHHDHIGRYQPREIIQPFMRSARLDPSLALGLTHAVELTIREGDRAAYDSIHALWEPRGSESFRERFRLMAEIRWAPDDSVPGILARSLRSLDPIEDRSNIWNVQNMVGRRARLDSEFDPRYAVVAADTFLAIFGDEDWATWSAHDIRLTGFAMMGQADSAIAAFERLLVEARAPTWTDTDELMLAGWRVWNANRGDIPFERAAADVPVLEALLEARPWDYFHLYERAALTGDLTRARRMSSEIEEQTLKTLRLGDSTAVVDTATVVALSAAWARIVLGDTIDGLAEYDRAMHDIGFRTAGNYIGWADYGLWLVSIPERRAQGIRVLRNTLWTTRYGTVATWYALARAYEAEGDEGNARLAWGHLVRLLEHADPWRRPMYDEAVSALDRLTPDR